MLEDVRGKAALVTGRAPASARRRAGWPARGPASRSTTTAAPPRPRRSPTAIRAAGGTAVLVRGDLHGEAGPEVVAAAVARSGGSTSSSTMPARSAGSPSSRSTRALPGGARPQRLGHRGVAGGRAASRGPGGGAIVNVGSIAGNNGGGPGSGHYAAAKAYIHNLTRHMAKDLAREASASTPSRRA